MGTNKLTKLSKLKTHNPTKDKHPEGTMDKPLGPNERLHLTKNSLFQKHPSFSLTFMELL